MVWQAGTSRKQQGLAAQQSSRRLLLRRAGVPTRRSGMGEVVGQLSVVSHFLQPTSSKRLSMVVLVRLPSCGAKGSQ